jgi:heat-inducible transcriptional repressor
MVGLSDNMSDLTERQETILGLVVREYVADKTPVGSQALVKKYKLMMSSATVRAEMALLESMGYLSHPHTSAGRIPTEEGYRYFVHRLIGETQLPLHEQRMIRHQFHQARLDVDQWMQLDAAVLAHISQSAAVVTPPHMRQSRFKHVELISTQGRLVLLVLVLGSGQVMQQMLTLAQPLTQEELSRAADRLNAVCDGLSAREIGVMLRNLSVLEQEVGSLIQEMVARADERIANRIYREGLSNLLESQDFDTGETILQGVRLLEERSLLEDVLATSLTSIEPVVGTGGGSVQVVIGGEGRWDQLRDWSMVLARYGLADYAVGALGVLGPTRMPYGRVISAVRYVAGLMSGLMYEVYGYEPPA